MIPGWKDWVRAHVFGRVASVIRFAQVTVNTASGDGDAVQGNQTTDEEAPGDYQYQVRRLWPFGIRSRPPAGVDAAVVHAFGGSTNGMMVGAESPEYGPDDLQDGEVCIYAKKAGARIKIDVDGKITIDAPDTADVVVNGGVARVNREGDAVVQNSPMATWMSAVTLATGVPALVGTDIGLTGPGALRFKA